LPVLLCVPASHSALPLGSHLQPQGCSGSAVELIEVAPGIDIGADFFTTVHGCRLQHNAVGSANICIAVCRCVKWRQALLSVRAAGCRLPARYSLHCSQLGMPSSKRLHARVPHACPPSLWPPCFHPVSDAYSILPCPAPLQRPLCCRARRAGPHGLPPAHPLSQAHAGSHLPALLSMLSVLRSRHAVHAAASRLQQPSSSPAERAVVIFSHAVLCCGPKPLRVSVRAKCLPPAPNGGLACRPQSDPAPYPTVARLPHAEQRWHDCRPQRHL